MTSDLINVVNEACSSNRLGRDSFKVVTRGSNPPQATIYDVFWLAGILEGEGSFLHGPPSAPNKPGISIEMTDEDVVSRVAFLLGISYQKYQRKSWKPTYKCYLRGERAARIMLILMPMLGHRRQKQIGNILEAYVFPKRGNGTRLLSDEAIHELADFVGSGNTQADAARKYRVSESTVNRIVKETFGPIV